MEKVILVGACGLLSIGLAWIVSKQLRVPLAQALMWLGVGAFTLHVGYAIVEPEGFGNSILDGVLMGKAKNSPMLMKFEGLDQEFGNYAEKGNVVLGLRGFDAAKMRDRDFLIFEYFRSVYAVYPRRVFCGERTNVVNNGRDLMALNFNPGPEWLNAHDVATVVSFRVNEQDQLDKQVTNRPAGGRWEADR